ncbi:glycerol dehydrogenase [Ihubacter massiliensis]|uniref:glycerol dehydrogenase n=1 Tax=Ihubacter massiliensis TaxID=1852367 RepID=UPI0020984121|nr:glycerol dehydrogenase [Ihubacter massiliensis]MCO7123008.1 glycerol dehydrogenase [Ihubacter massiliensis]
MAKSLTAPARYYQGSALLSQSYRYVSHLGRRFAIIADRLVKELVEERIEEGFRDAGNSCVFIHFNGETTLGEVARLTALIHEENCSGIIGVGGGKAIDAAKLVGDTCGLPVVIAPTSAATDAPCSSMAVLYSEEGAFHKVQKLKSGPQVVLVDTEIISKAPVRLLISGMGDAFATYYEARACERAGVQNYTGGIRMHTSLTLAELCRDLLLKYGYQAKRDVEAKRDTQAVENVVEANIFLSGIGFENNGCAAAHAVQNGMTAVVKPFAALHGEGVALGTLTQLIMEYNESGRWNQAEWNQAVTFYRKVGLPLSFQHIGITDADDLLLDKIAKASVAPDSKAHNMPFEVTQEKIFTALRQLRDMEL